MHDFFTRLIFPGGRRPPKPAPTKVVGTGGTAVFGGYIQSNEKEASLTGRARYQTFSDILANVSIVSAGMRYFLNLISKSGWKLEPAEDSGDEGRRIADLMDEILNDMVTPWHRVVRRASTYRFYGFGVQEWTAKLRPDGVMGLQDIEPRAQMTIERWDVGEKGNVMGMFQRSPQTQFEFYLPRSKVVYIVDDSLNDSPEGLGLFRHLVEPAQQLRRFEQLEGWGFETDLRGIPIVRIPLQLLQELVDAGKLSPAERQKLIQPMLDFASGHIKSDKTGFALDSAVYETTDDKQAPSTVRQWDVELMKGSNTSAEAVAASIERKNREMARILGVEQLLLGSTSAGSFAMSKDKTGAFFLIVDSSLVEVRESMQKDVIGTLMMLNGWSKELEPVLKFDPAKFQDVDQTATILNKLALSGAPMAMDDPAINEIRDILGISRVDLEKLAAQALIGGGTGNGVVV